MTGRTDPPDPLTEIETLARSIDPSAWITGEDLRDDILWLVAELRAAREQLAIYEELTDEREADRRIKALEAELAAAHHVIAAIRPAIGVYTEGAKTGALWTHLGNCRTLATTLAAFDANHPAQGESS